jgi:hypothetical protein
VPDLTDTIAEIAANPKGLAVGGESVTEHTLPELIAADKHLAEKAAAAATGPTGAPASAWGLLRPARAVPPGAA